MPSQQERIGWPMLDVQFSRALDEPFLRFRSVPLFPRHPLGITSQRIGFGHSIQKIRLASPRETTKRAFAYFITLFVKLARLQMFPHQPDNLAAHVISVNRVYVDTIEKTFSRRHARFLMSARAHSAVYEFSGSRLSKIVGQRRQHDRHLLRVRKLID